MLASAKQGDDGDEVVPVVQTHAEEMEDLKRGFLDAASVLEGATALVCCNLVADSSVHHNWAPDAVQTPQWLCTSCSWLCT